MAVCLQPNQAVIVTSRYGAPPLLGSFVEFDGCWARVLVYDEDFPEGRVINFDRRGVMSVPYPGES